MQLTASRVVQALALVAWWYAGEAHLLEPQWQSELARTNAVPTFLDQVNPSMDRSSHIHDAVFEAMAELKCDFIRYLHWTPFPYVTVAEPSPPVGIHTSWDFSLIDQYVEDFMNATKGHDSVINFSGWPDWMNANATHPRDPSCQEMGEYFSRIVSWYTKGGFVDEMGRHYDGGHHYPWRYWEVLNEQNSKWTAPFYTACYDGIATVLLRDHPEIVLTGVVTAGVQVDWISYFLNSSHHADPSVMPSFVTYHWYANPHSNDTTTWMSEFMEEAWAQLPNVKGVRDAVRANGLEDRVKVSANEVGVIAGGHCPVSTLFTSDRFYWNVESVLYAFLYGQLASLDVYSIATSQITGYPAGTFPHSGALDLNYPCVSMMNWKDGSVTARWWTLKLFVEVFGSSEKTFHAVTGGDTPTDPVYSFGVTVEGRRVVLAANVGMQPQNVTIQGEGGKLFVVDEEHGYGSVPYLQSRVKAGETIHLNRLAVVVLVMDS